MANNPKTNLGVSIREIMKNPAEEIKTQQSGKEHGFQETLDTRSSLLIVASLRVKLKELSRKRNLKENQNAMPNEALPDNKLAEEAGIIIPPTHQ